MADLRLCNELALRISLSFFERLGLALDRLEVTFLPADVRGSRLRDSQNVRIACSHQVEILRDMQETCLFHRIHQTWPHPLHERRLMNQQENQGPQLPQQNPLSDSQHVRTACPHQLEILHDVQATCLFHRFRQTRPHQIHERQHARRKICLAPQLMTQQENQGPWLPQHVHLRPQDRRIKIPACWPC